MDDVNDLEFEIPDADQNKNQTKGKEWNPQPDHENQKYLSDK